MEADEFEFSHVCDCFKIFYVYAYVSFMHGNSGFFDVLSQEFRLHPLISVKFHYRSQISVTRQMERFGMRNVICYLVFARVYLFDTFGLQYTLHTSLDRAIFTKYEL